MGSELQGKYQKLAQEYAKLRGHVDVLKRAVKDEKSQKETLEESLREKTQILRKHVQENESLEFRNQQLSKRVTLLQEELNSSSKNKKRKAVPDGLVPEVPGVHAQELAAKISENESLHMKVLEVTQKSERTEADLKAKVASLEQEVSEHAATVEELKKEHESRIQKLQTERAMVEVKLAKHSAELEEMKRASERRQPVSSHVTDDQTVHFEVPANDSSEDQRSWLDTGCTRYTDLNVPIVDTKLQFDVLQALKCGVDLVSTFTTQMSTFHSYLEQRCKAYPIDTATGLHISAVNQKLCELLHSSSGFTRPVVNTLVQLCNVLKSNPYSQTTSFDLEDFASAHHKFAVYLEIISPYIQLSLREEYLEPVCGSQLTETNIQLSQTLPILGAMFTSVDNYLSIIARGPSGGFTPAALVTCFEKLCSCFTDILVTLNEISSYFSSKTGQEYQLPTASQKLNTTNECIVSSLAGLISTVEQLSEFLENNREVFSGTLLQNIHVPGAEQKKESTSSSVVQRLRLRAANYIRGLQRECPESVPYTLAVYNTRSLSSSSENKETLMKQVIANQGKLAQLEQEKEQLTLDLQLLGVKYEKEQKKVSVLEEELGRLPGQSSSPLPSQPSLNTSMTSLTSSLQTQPLSNSVGSLNAIGVDRSEEEPSDEALREELIRKHFTARIAELSTQLQAVDSKAAYNYAECRALHKQLIHGNALRSKGMQDLQTSDETIKQLQDQLTTTSSNYEKQLSAMSDHLCELNDKLLKQTDELEALRKSKGKRWGK